MGERHAIEDDLFVGSTNSDRGRAKVASHYKDNHSSAPYSDYRVGGAITVADEYGDWYTALTNYRTYGGANVEDAARQTTMHAEQMALSKAIMDGFDRLLSVTVVTSGDDNPFPCGNCRQLMSEWGREDTEVTAAREDGNGNYEYKRSDLGGLIPEGFRSDF